MPGRGQPLLAERRTQGCGRRCDLGGTLTRGCSPVHLSTTALPLAVSARVLDGAALIMRAVAEGGSGAAGPLREAALSEGAMLHHLLLAFTAQVGHTFSRSPDFAPTNGLASPVVVASVAAVLVALGGRADRGRDAAPTSAGRNSHCVLHLCRPHNLVILTASAESQWPRALPCRAATGSAHSGSAVCGVFWAAPFDLDPQEAASTVWQCQRRQGQQQLETL